MGDGGFIAVVTALPEELAPLLSRLSGRAAERRDGARLWRGRLGRTAGPPGLHGRRQRERTARSPLPPRRRPARGPDRGRGRGRRHAGSPARDDRVRRASLRFRRRSSRPGSRLARPGQGAAGRDRGDSLHGRSGRRRGRSAARARGPASPGPSRGRRSRVGVLVSRRGGAGSPVSGAPRDLRRGRRGPAGGPLRVPDPRRPDPARLRRPRCPVPPRDRVEAPRASAPRSRRQRAPRPVRRNPAAVRFECTDGRPRRSPRKNQPHVRALDPAASRADAPRGLGRLSAVSHRGHVRGRGVVGSGGAAQGARGLRERFSHDLTPGLRPPPLQLERGPAGRGRRPGQAAKSSRPGGLPRPPARTRATSSC